MGSNEISQAEPGKGEVTPGADGPPADHDPGSKEAAWALAVDMRQRHLDLTVKTRGYGYYQTLKHANDKGNLHAANETVSGLAHLTLLNTQPSDVKSLDPRVLSIGDVLHPPEGPHPPSTAAASPPQAPAPQREPSLERSSGSSKTEAPSLQNKITLERERVTPDRAKMAARSWVLTYEDAAGGDAYSQELILEAVDEWREVPRGAPYVRGLLDNMDTINPQAAFALRTALTQGSNVLYFGSELNPGSTPIYQTELERRLNEHKPVTVYTLGGTHRASAEAYVRRALKNYPGGDVKIESRPDQFIRAQEQIRNGEQINGRTSILF